MKNALKIFTSSILIIFLLQGYAFGGVTFYTEMQDAKLIKTYSTDLTKAISFDDRLTMISKEESKKPRQKLSFKQKIALKFMKRKIKKMAKKPKKTKSIKSQKEKDPFTFHMGGFGLGFGLGLLGALFLGLIGALIFGLVGVLIAYLLIGSEAGLSSLIGAGSIVTLYLLFLAIIIALSIFI